MKEDLVDSLFDKEIKCPVCENKYTSKKVRTSKIAIAKKHLDFYMEYRYDNPAYYAIFVCPFCGYASFESDLNKVTADESTLIRRRVTSLWNSKNYGVKRDAMMAADTYKLAYICYKLRRTKSIVYAKIALRLSHIYRDISDEEMTKRYEKIALDYFKEAYSSGEGYSREEDLEIKFMIADLNRKGKFYNESLKWFDLLLRDPMLKNKPIMDKNAHELILMVRDGIKNNY